MGPSTLGWRARTAVGDDNSDDEAVDAKYTRHDNGDDRLHHEVRLHHAHGRHTNAGLGGAVRSAKVCVQGRRAWRHRLAGARHCDGALQKPGKQSAFEVYANAHTVPAPGAARIFVERSGVLAKMSATAAPMKPKKGALAGQSSFDMSLAARKNRVCGVDRVHSFTTLPHVLHSHRGYYPHHLLLCMSSRFCPLRGQLGTGTSGGGSSGDSLRASAVRRAGVASANFRSL